MSEKEHLPEPCASVVGSEVDALLTEGQRRSLGTVLRRIERTVWEMEELLAKDERPDLLLTQVTHLPDSLQQDALLRLAQSIRQEVVSLASTLGIVAQEEDQLRRLHALFTLLWVDLEGARPQRLGSYGAVHPQLPEKLGPGIQRLADLVLAITDVVNGMRNPHTA